MLCFHFRDIAVICYPAHPKNAPHEEGTIGIAAGEKGKEEPHAGSFIKKIYLANPDNGLSELKITPREKLIGSYK